MRRGVFLVATAALTVLSLELLVGRDSTSASNNVDVRIEVDVSGNSATDLGSVDDSSSNVTVIDVGAAPTATPGTVGLGKNGWGLALDSSTGKVYASHYTGVEGRILQGPALATPAVFSDSGASCVNPQVRCSGKDVAINNAVSPKLLYIAHQNTDDVSVYNLSTASLTDSIAVGDSPRGVAVNEDENLIYVSNRDGGTLSRIDGSTNDVTGEIDLGNSSHPIGVFVHPDSGLVYVALEGYDMVAVVCDHDAYTTDSDGDSEVDHCDLDDDDDSGSTTAAFPANSLCRHWEDAAVPVFFDCIEEYLGTDTLDDCTDATGSFPSAEWPPDVVASGSINISDILAFQGKIGMVDDRNDPDDGFPTRFDLNATHSISISDVLTLNPYFGTSC